MPSTLQIPNLARDIAAYIVSEQLAPGTRLPARASENELMRRYGSSRATVVRAMQRAASEGWTERLPGRGWGFIPLLTSALTYEQICRYRIIVEPAAILEPTFILNRPALEACRKEQMALFDSGGSGLSPVEIFDSGSRFHQIVLDCSNNRAPPM